MNNLIYPVVCSKLKYSWRFNNSKIDSSSFALQISTLIHKMDNYSSISMESTLQELLDQYAGMLNRYDITTLERLFEVSNSALYVSYHNTTYKRVTLGNVMEVTNPLNRGNIVARCIRNLCVFSQYGNADVLCYKFKDATRTTLINEVSINQIYLWLLNTDACVHVELDDDSTILSIEEYNELLDLDRNNTREEIRMFLSYFDCNEHCLSCTDAHSLLNSLTLISEVGSDLYNLLSKVSYELI